jgi:hypothetical protein
MISSTADAKAGFAADDGAGAIVGTVSKGGPISKLFAGGGTGRASLCTAAWTSQTGGRR